ncbi:unknown [Prevotella sp. CAG:755]|nr:unknown [Prevotella sp. CAG:755]
MDKAAVHVDCDLGRVELHVLIVDLAAAIKPGQTGVRVIDHRVLCRVGDGIGDTGAFFVCTVSCKTVSQQRINRQRVGRKQRQGEAVAGHTVRLFWNSYRIFCRPDRFFCQCDRIGSQCEELRHFLMRRAVEPGCGLECVGRSIQHRPEEKHRTAGSEAQQGKS